ncbi:AAA family ATPase [Yersinia enterocolitica]|uniref:AAA family ATPase n=1 Tax=Yersinia enterocolitica TaxID=630 RepID=UPI0005E1AFD6|nr:DUF3696 domain-containing protein [Yersinia enterocolitica]CNL00868.1 Uncharacterized conserved protein [Yersinia enterocolitica]
MFNNLKLKSFKSFDCLDISLSNLTVLTGLNSSGKSSAIQALRMWFLAKKNISPYIEGYGDFGELKSKFTNLDTPISICVMDDNDDYEELILTKKEIKNNRRLKRVMNFDYIAADRFGPSPFLPVMGYDKKYISIGDKGQFCADYFLKFENVTINEVLRHSGTKSTKLSHQLEQWMGEITPGVSLTFGKEEKHDLTHLEVDGYRATNTGFGISYTLPIVLSALVMSSKEALDNFEDADVNTWFNNNIENTPVLLIENPEAHLHPRGQTAMGELIARTAASGVQVIVETHSDHFLDGIRIAVRKNKNIKCDMVKINYFSKSKNGVSSVEEIKVLENGKLDKWPEGFFDQMSTNLRQLSM